MSPSLRRHAVVVAFLSLVLAAGASTAHAQTRWMVSGADVVDESLTAADLALASVGTSEVAYASLTANDLGKDSVGASELNLKVESVSNFITNSSMSKTVTATCPYGYTVLAGGGDVSASQGGEHRIALTESAPSGVTGWTVTAKAIAFPAEKTNWDHRHTGDGYTDIAWKDWIWTHPHDYTLDWKLEARALCIEL